MTRNVLIGGLIAFTAVAGAARADGDVEAGKKVFNLCSACHSLMPGDNRVGPSLAGLYGRTSGMADGYAYSPAMKASGIVWTDETLDPYLTAPQQYVKGSKMPITVPSPADRANVIAYLKSLKGN